MTQSFDRHQYIASRLSPLSKYQVFPEKTYIINHQYKFIYCPIPKVASTSIKQAIIGLTNTNDDWQCIHTYTSGRFSLGIYHHEDAKKFLQDRQYWRFAFIRNPWTRIISSYVSKFAHPTRKEAPSFAKRVIDWVYADLGLETNYEKSITFKQFLKYVVTTENQQLDIHWKPQNLFLSKNYAFDFIGQFENIEQDFEYVQEKLNIQLKLPWKNKKYEKVKVSKGSKEFYDYYPHELKQLSNMPLYQQFYNSDLIDLVAKKYSQDIAIFNYKFNGE